MPSQAAGMPAGQDGGIQAALREGGGATDAAKREALPLAVPEEIRTLVSRWKEITGRAPQPMRTYLRRAKLSLGGENRLQLVLEDGPDSDYFLKEEANRSALEALLENSLQKRVEVEYRAVKNRTEFEGSYVDLNQVIHMDIEEE